MSFVNLRGLGFKLTLDYLVYFAHLSLNLKYKGDKYVYRKSNIV